MSGILLATVGNSYGSAPVNTVAPVVSGTASFGSTLTTTNGTWLGAPAPTFTYQWQRVTTNISGATSSTYVLVAADVGNTIRCVVRATNSVAPSGVTANSNSTASVAATVPGAPTIGTATATGATTATVVYTAPASDGGATITSYTATSSPSGITGTLSQAGSGTITVTGLTAITSYTFTVTATNSAGTSAASSASNSITTAAVPSQVVYCTTGTYSWVAPAGVTKVSVIVVGPPGTEGPGNGGAGGSLAYKNNITVVPANSYTVVLGSLTSTQTTYFNSSCVVSATGGNNGASGAYIGDGGGAGGPNYGSGNWGGGGGAGGYSGAGGQGGKGQSAIAGAAGSGGGGGGGGGACFFAPGGGGGGVGILGAGSNGSGGARGQSYCTCPPNQSTTGYSSGGGGGSGGGSGSGGTTSLNYCTGIWSNGTSQGGNYGGGKGSNTCHGTGLPGKSAVRIIWPGCARAFPSTRTANE